ncbi:FtsW/RodA/SpoVE family cell cycle protein, partial [Mucilaginibacter sp.]|uniref:FtsW/RodA/SpoVE family cell cycle protein n=1 Tax=Mucilaginibacter sp. TaxID=1882438 RepID=UPI000CC0F019
MEADKVQQPGRWTERIFIVLLTALFVCLFLRLHTVLQTRFTDVDKRLQDGTMINLNAGHPAGQLKRLLTKGYYFEDKKDIDLITSTVANATDNHLQIDNIGELNKRKYFIVADDAFAQGGKSFKSRVEASRALLGYTGADSSLFVSEKSNPKQVPQSTDLNMGSGVVAVNILNKQQPVGGVLVRLQMVLPQDSIYNDEEIEEVKRTRENGNGFTRVFTPDSAGRPHLQELIAYARTNEQGVAQFTHLPNGKAFKVLPLQPGYQFGTSQGIQELDDDATFTFNQQPHTIRLFSTRDFNILKKEKSLTIRTVDDFNHWFYIIVGSFLGAFLLVHIVLSIGFRNADQLILPVIMTLTGLSFITLLSLQDPLRDRFLAKDMLFYLGIGLVAMLVMLFFNLRRFTPDSWVYRMLVFKQNRAAANGWPWVALAATLLALTIKFGTGPEGSGVKVNLFGFQPSEIVKYLIILFLAGFFAANEKLISEYTSWNKRWQFFSFALIAILVTLFLFLILGDLGPAMVVLFTFIVLFSFSRGDFMFMAIAVVLYVLVSWFVKNVWLAALITAVAVSLMMLFN